MTMTTFAPAAVPHPRCPTRPPTPLPSECPQARAAAAEPLKAALSSFEQLPEVLHRHIVSMFPEINLVRYSGQSKSVNLPIRACVSECSRTLLHSYYGAHWPSVRSITEYDPQEGERYSRGLPFSTLVSFLQRQQGLQSFTFDHSLEFFIHDLITKEGVFQNLKELRVIRCADVFTRTLSTIVSSSDQCNNPLPALERLEVKGLHVLEKVTQLAEVLGQGVLPSLRDLTLGMGGLQQSHPCVFDTLAAMVKGRAKHPECRPLEHFRSSIIDWLEDDKQDQRCYREFPDNTETEAIAPRDRLLRVLLPSVRSLPPFTWAPAFEKCFVEMKPMYLNALEMCLDDDFPVPSSVWESLPALETLAVQSYSDETGQVHIPPLLSAFERGAMPRLRELDLHRRSIGDADLADLFWALGQSPCASCLTSVKVTLASAGNETMDVLGDLLKEDRLPSLSVLDIRGGRKNGGNSGDPGVQALCEGLLGKTTRTRLKDLVVAAVGMGDAGMAALGSLFGAGRGTQLKNLTLSEHPAVTDVGMRALAQGLEVVNVQPQPVIIEICDLRRTTLAGQAALAKVSEIGCYGCNAGTAWCGASEEVQQRAILDCATSDEKEEEEEEEDEEDAAWKEWYAQLKSTKEGEECVAWPEWYAQWKSKARLDASSEAKVDEDQEDQQEVEENDEEED